VGFAMSMMMMKCPASGKAVTTGIELDAGTFFCLPDIFLHVRCPHCDLQHSCWTHEAWLEGQTAVETKARRPRMARAK
jgi:hypothetical protein